MDANDTFDTAEYYGLDTIVTPAKETTSQELVVKKNYNFECIYHDNVCTDCGECNLLS